MAEQEPAEAEAADAGGLKALDKLVEGIHTSAKWLIGGYATVAVLLVPGLGLGSIGALSGGDLVMAGLAGVGAILAALYAAFQVSHVLTSDDPTIGELAARDRREGREPMDPLVRYLRQNPLLFQGRAGGAQELSSKVTAAKDARAAAERHLEEAGAGLSKDQRGRLEDLVAVKRANVESLELVADSVETVARYQAARHEFVQRGWSLGSATLIVALALAVFAVLTHPAPKGTSDFEGAVVERIDLSGTNLSRAQLNGARFSEVTLHGAILDGADLDGATFPRSRCPDGRLSKRGRCSAFVPGRKRPVRDAGGGELHAGR